MGTRLELALHLTPLCGYVPALMVIFGILASSGMVGMASKAACGCRA